MNDSNTLDRHVPKYIRIAEALKLDMARGVLSPGDQLPSFAEMTQQFQVAKHTIDKAHAILEREGLVRREQGRGIFVEAKQKKKLTGNIGLVLPVTARHELYTLELLAGVQQQARAYDVNLMLVDDQRPINTENIDGILLFCNHYQVAPLGLSPAIPRVLLLAPAMDLDIANVVADDFGGAKAATLHLLQLGHRRISFMPATKYDAYSVQRVAGYRAALQEFGIPYEEKFCYFDEGGRVVNYFLSGEKRMNAWLESGWRELNATAILAPNDMGALGIMKVLDAAGIKVPRDVSVVGFDGVHIGEGPPLTTLQVPLREIGVTGTQLLWEQIQAGGYFSKQMTLPVSLVTGQSTIPV
jgi:LacI family transcriptional regulator